MANFKALASLSTSFWVPTKIVDVTITFITSFSHFVYGHVVIGRFLRGIFSNEDRKKVSSRRRGTSASWRNNSASPTDGKW